MIPIDDQLILAYSFSSFLHIWKDVSTVSDPYSFSVVHSIPISQCIKTKKLVEFLRRSYQINIKSGGWRDPAPDVDLSANSLCIGRSATIKVRTRDNDERCVPVISDEGHAVYVIVDINPL